MRVLLHTCCGPCASACVPRLVDEGHDVTLFFSNSNIDTAEEFERRREAAAKLADHDGVQLVVDDYDHDAWLGEAASGYENEPERGARCARCFRFSLARTARYAAEHGYDAFATSLTVSPHKVSKMVFAASDDPSAATLIQTGSKLAVLAAGSDKIRAKAHPAANLPKVVFICRFPLRV